MKFTLPLLSIGALILSGCVAQEQFIKNNISYSMFERDRATCETKATQEIPVNRSVGGEVVVALFTGVYAAQDANAPARLKNYESCMISNGYQRIEFPACKDMNSARKNGVGPLSANKLISVAPGSCVTNDTKGRVIFHNEQVTPS